MATKDQWFDIINDFIKRKDFDIIITSYEGINICKKDLKKIDWMYIIVDEAHWMKNDESLFSLNIRELPTQMRLLLTGTPL